MSNLKIYFTQPITMESVNNNITPVPNAATSTPATVATSTTATPDPNIQPVASLKRSPYDSRDWKYINKQILTVIVPPTEIDYRSQLKDVRNQGIRGTCASFATAAMKEWQELKDVGFKSYMSPEFIYDNREDPTATGMYPRDVMRILSTIGICPEDVYPYNATVDKLKTDIPQVAFDIALKFTIASYAQISSQIELQIALANSGPCLVAFPCYNNTVNFWKPSKPNEQLIGGHAVLCVGYNSKGYIIRNSWGTSWGDNGYTYYNTNDWGSHWEIWSSVDNKTTVPITPVPQPITPVPQPITPVPQPIQPEQKQVRTQPKCCFF